MAKMIKHKDSFVNKSIFVSMFKGIDRVDKITDTSSLVHMDDQKFDPIEVKAPFSVAQIIETIENSDYEGEIAAHLFSYYIGEI